MARFRRGRPFYRHNRGENLLGPRPLFLSAAPEAQLLDSWTALGGLAAVTERIRLGTMVTDAQLQTPAGSEDHEPAWSPDGASIVFTRINDTADPLNQQALFIVPSNGGEAHQITPWAPNAGGANWSPDGSTILFESYRDCPCDVTSQVYTVRPDGSGVAQLTKAGRDIEPNWSPNGKQIIYGHQPGVGPDHFADLSGDGCQRQEPIARRPDQAVGERARLGNRATDALIGSVSGLPHLLKGARCSRAHVFSRT